MIKSAKLNTIFWKIFLSYWLVMVLIIVATIVTVGLLTDREHVKFRQQVADSVQASTAISLYDAAGEKGLKNWLHGRRGKHGHHHTFLINEEGQDVLGRPVPPKLLSSINQGKSPPVTNKHHRWHVQKVVSTKGQEYWFANQSFKGKHSFRPRLWPAPIPRYFKGLTLVLALLVTGLISYWLARNITTPIRKLQQASQNISEGDFTTRVDPAVSQRKDELGELSRDFDRMAEQIEQLLASQQRILGDVSHELRSPLARLQVALELARKASGEQAQAEHERIEIEANRLDELIGQVLSLVRLETRAGSISKEEINLEELLEAIVADADFEAQSQSKSVSLNVTGNATLSVNIQLLHSAFENIIRNAVRYTHEQTAVEVTMHAQAQEVKVVIRDHGPGAADHALEHLFKPFYREADARDRASGGYGLGLAIAERAIKAHGGNVSASNASDGGLQVNIRLPAIEENSNPKQA